MVQVGDFTVHIVDAETNIPFKEHLKDGKTFAEVEPDIDYFIAIQKTSSAHHGDHDVNVIKFFVDDKDLGFTKHYLRTTTAELTHYGVWKRDKGVDTTTALRFVKPHIDANGDRTASNLMMGKVDIKVFNGKSSGSYNPSEQTAVGNKLDADVVNAQALQNKKSLRTATGSAVESKQMPKGQVVRYTTGEHHLYTITLNYCTALGLIHVGVLPKPDAWAHHRMMYPAQK